MIIDVIPEKRTGQETETYSYSVPKDLENQVKIGSIVEMPFGKKTIRGVVSDIGRHSGLPPRQAEGETGDPESKKIELDSHLRGNDKVAKPYDLKNIISINPVFVIPKDYIDIAKWISEYYLCSLGEAISLFTPPEMKRLKVAKPTTNNQQPTTDKVELTTEQKTIFDDLKKKLLVKEKNPSLLFGVTGSGKTEIYIKLVEEVLKQKKQAIILTPEIMLTPKLVEKFEQSFPDQICLMHSGLSKSEKYNSYAEFYSGRKSIMIGPRSALLVPSTNLGLLIIDEEQEDAYKQEKNPRYNAVEMAEKIAQKNNALLLLGTATPRIESYYKCHPELVSGSPNEEMPKQVRHDNSYDIFTLKSRYQKLFLPPARIIDLKNELKKDNHSPISEELKSAIFEVLKNKKQIILFLNRRGMSTFVSCRDCGEVLMCPKCSIPLIYHINFGKNILNCHHCDHTEPVPRLCPNCQSPRIKFFGAGVDKIVKEVERIFPKARIRKVDSKSLQNRGDYEKLYQDIKNKKIDILVGTQILAKGLDLPSVDLVGVVSADTGLHLPYFRANEKVFQIVTQVSGRSGRKHNPGQTLIQTYWPDSNAIRCASNHDFECFYYSEILERKKYNYPPFCHLVRVISEDRHKENAKKKILDVAEKLKKEKIEFIGPGHAFLFKINNRFRYHLIIKTNDLPNKKLTEIFKSDPYLTWDVDPVDML